MKMNKLCSNLDQSNPDAGGFTNEEKRTMRNNIAASQIQYVNATPGHQPTSEVGDLFVVEYESGKHFNDGNGNIGVLVPEPASGTIGHVLQNTSTGVRWMSQQELPDSIMWDPIKNGTGSGNTYMITVSDDINRYNYNQILGFVTFNTQTSGNFSIVPCDASGNYLSKYGSQCWNIPGTLGTINPYTFPFYFRMDGTHDIHKIGIKGASASSQASIGMLIVEGKINATDSRPTA